MFKPTAKHIELANKISQNDMPLPAGYRIAIFPLTVDLGLKDAEAAKYTALGGFIDKSEVQKEREERGNHFAILCHVGSGAFQGDYASSGKGPVPREGDVIVFNKYAGLRQEFPPGSGDFYQYCNDEDILSHYEKNVLEIDNG